MGPVCKHIVAVIFHLQQDELKLNQPVIPKPRKKKTKSVSQQVKELLKTISHKELIEFVEENTQKDREFRVYFLASFGHINGTECKEFYQNQIHSCLQTAKGRDGWISWHEMKFLNKTMQPVLENLAKNFENKNFEVVFLMSTALLEEMTKAFDFADDSSGDIGYFINVATESLTKLARSEEHTSELQSRG